MVAGGSIFTGGVFTLAPQMAPLTLADIRAQFDEVNRQRRLLGYDALVKPFLPPDAGKRLLQQILKKRNKPGEVTAATITWGQASNFEVKTVNLPFLSSLGQGGDTKKKPLDSLTITYTETGRETETVRVSNPDDASMWVDVKRIKAITFIGDDGAYRRFVLHN